MKKILIVDDNENNRVLLRALLEDYAQENPRPKLIVSEAVNGIEAVAVAAEESPDLIFMDIMMPEMDGIEATRRIRSADPLVMIIAVSAVDDAARQKEILRSGAEDYISKPINTEILRARLSHYFTLIASRHRSIQHRHRAVNLFNEEIYSRELSFFIDEENDLAEFWEYYLLNPQQGIGCERLSDTVRTLYAIGSIAVQLKFSPRIRIEESEKYLYFTMEGIEELEPKIIRLVLAKNPSLSDYRQEKGKISIRVLHSQCVGSKRDDYEEMAAAAENIIVTHPDENSVYDYMDEEDLEEIKEYISRLDSLMLLVGGSDIHVHEVEEIAQNLERIGKIASLYSDSYVIGRALSTLAEEIRTHIEGFLEKSGALGPLCAAFSRDLTGWIRIIFTEGAPSVNYMDDTISTNAQMIGSMLNMDESSDEAVDLDDIFDF